MNDNTLIAYFSRAGDNYVEGSIVNLPVGNTEVAARMIAEQIGGVLVRIDPVREYSGDYTTCTREAQEELRSGARPELRDYPSSIASYDTVILCYPNWWGTMPMPVWTFLEHFNLSGKKILPLCTHEGSQMGSSDRDIENICPEANVLRGLAITGGSVQHAQKHMESWLSGLV